MAKLVNDGLAARGYAEKPLLGSDFIVPKGVVGSYKDFTLAYVDSSGRVESPFECSATYDLRASVVHLVTAKKL